MIKVMESNEQELGFQIEMRSRKVCLKIITDLSSSKLLVSVKLLLIATHALYH